jgi:DNA repair ATPase RecN
MIGEAKKEVEGYGSKIASMTTKLQRVKDRLGDFDIPEIVRKLQKDQDTFTRLVTSCETDIDGINTIIEHLDNYNQDQT